MAIDTVAKRQSCLRTLSGYPAWLVPIPDGTVASADMQTLLGMYSGIAAAVPVLVPVVNVYVGPQPRY